MINVNECKPLISIIIPVYNAEKDIYNCYTSLLEQSYKNFEVIFIDDCSQDKSFEILKKIRKEEKLNIVVKHSNKNCGASLSRNIGLSVAKGDYITFIDVDDDFANDFLEKLLFSVTNNNCDLVICNYYDVYNNSKVEIRLPWSNESLTFNQVRNLLIPNLIYPLNGENFLLGTIWRVMVKRNIIVDNNIKFIEEIRIGEDLIFLIELLSNLNKIYILDDCLYFYNRKTNSTLNTYHKNDIHREINYYNFFESVLKKYDLYEFNEFRYNSKKLRMYTVLLSNAVRNENKTDSINEIKLISDLFNNSNIKFLKYNFSFLINLTFFLLSKKKYKTLYILYKIKEKLRINKFK